MRRYINSPVSLQDVRFDLEDPTVIRLERDIRLWILISDLLSPIAVPVPVLVGGRSGRADLAIITVTETVVDFVIACSGVGETGSSEDVGGCHLY